MTSDPLALAVFLFGVAIFSTALVIATVFSGLTVLLFWIVYIVSFALVIEIGVSKWNS